MLFVFNRKPIFHLITSCGGRFSEEHRKLVPFLRLTLKLTPFQWQCFHFGAAVHIEHQIMRIWIVSARADEASITQLAPLPVVQTALINKQKTPNAFFIKLCRPCVLQRRRRKTQRPAVNKTQNLPTVGSNASQTEPLPPPHPSSRRGVPGAQTKLYPEI